MKIKLSLSKILNLFLIFSLFIPYLSFAQNDERKDQVVVDEQTIISAKERLKELGFYSGETGIEFGDDLREAIFEYQKQSPYLIETGKLDAETQGFLLGNDLYPETIDRSYLKRGGGSSTVCDVVYAAGGHDNLGYFNDFYYFDGTTWTQDTVPPWSGRGYPIFLVYDQKIWIMGGSTDLQVNNNDVWVYDPQTTTWTHFDNDPNTPGIQDAPWNPTTHFDGVVYDGKIWIIIPISGQVWNFDGTTWTHFDNDPNTPGVQNLQQIALFYGNGFELNVYDGKIWLLGGGSHIFPTNKVWSFDGTTWTPFDNNLNTTGIQDPPWNPRWELESQVFDGKLWIMGGKNSGSTYNDVWNFDGTTWTHFNNDPNTPGIQDAPWSPRWEFSTIVFHDKLWLMAGSAPFMRDVWNFDGTTWTHFDNDPNTPGIQNAPWSPRDGLMTQYIPCDELGIGGEASVEKTVSSINGNEVTYTISVENTGSSQINDINVYENLHIGMSYVSHTNPLGSTFSMTGNDIVFNIQTMAPGEVYEFSVTIELDYNYCDVYVNQVSIDFPGMTTGSVDNDSVQTPAPKKPSVFSHFIRKVKDLFKMKGSSGAPKYGIPCPTDLSLEKEYVGIQNGQAQFLIQLENLGPNNSFYYIVDSVSDNLDIISVNSNDADSIINIYGDTASMVGNIEVGEIVEFYVSVDLPNVIPDSGFEFVNNSSVSHSGLSTFPDLDPTNDSDEAEVVIPGPVLNEVK